MVPSGALVELDADDEVDGFGEVEVEPPEDGVLVEVAFEEEAWVIDVVGMVTVVACSSRLEVIALILAEATGTLPLVLTLHADLDFLVFEEVLLEYGDPDAIAPAGAVIPAADEDFAEEAALVTAAIAEAWVEEGLALETTALDEPLEAPE